MADIKKTKDIKDLKARLGRAGKPASTPGGSVPPGVVSPPSTPGLGFPPGSRPPGAGVAPGRRPPGAGVAPGSRPPGAGAAPGSRPPGLGMPLRPPPGAAQAPFAPTSQPGMATPTPGSGIVAPPFMQKQAAAPAAAARHDPFAAAAAAAPREKKVTLVLDETAVREGKSARRASARNRILLVIGFAAGVVLGMLMGMSSSESKISKLAEKDAEAVRETVEKVSKPVSEASGYMQKLASSVNGGKVDYSAIEKLLAFKKPMAPNAFHRRFFSNLQADTVDDLFRYSDNVEKLWGRFTLLGAKTAGQDKRAFIDKAAVKGKALDIKYGLAVRVVDGNVLGGLVFVTGGPRKAEGSKGKNVQYEIDLASRLGGKTVTKKLYDGQSSFLEDPQAFAFVVDEKANRAMLGEPPNVFEELKKDVTELNGIMQQTMETQGRLKK
jgi:hypothetical protein